MDAAEFIEIINDMKPYRLSAYARVIQDVEGYQDLKEEQGFSDDDMREIVIHLVKRMMKLNLVIPSHGSEVNLLAMAQDLHDDPEFGGKYDKLAEEVQDEKDQKNQNA